MSHVFIGNDFWKLKNDQKATPVNWDISRVSNHHIGVSGTSGAGKTHWIRQFINAMPEDVEIDIFDYHGDIEVANAKTVIFSEATKYGYNPLILNTDQHYGGVRRSINDLIEAINWTSRKLGTSQEGVLRNLLLDTYQIKGIMADSPKTWIKRESTDLEISNMMQTRNWKGLCECYPSLQEVIAFSKRKLKTLWFGLDESQSGKCVLAHFDDYCRLMKNLNQLQTKQRSGSDIESKLDDAKSKVLNKFSEFISNINSGDELDEKIKYSNKDVLLGVINRLENLNATGLFNSNPPPFGNARIRRYFLKPLAQSEDELKMFIRFRLRSIIREMMQKGESNGKLKRLIVIDESKKFCDEEANNPINIIVNEMRKFGVGILLASQSPAHFSQDFIKNAGTLLLLNLATADWDDACRKLKIELKDLKYLTPRDTGSIRMLENGRASSFKQIKF